MLVNPHYAPQAQASEVGRRRRHHGWASSRKREEPALGSSPLDDARLAACHRSRKGEGVTRQKRREIEVSVPARIARSPGLVARTLLLQLQKSVGDDWSRISSANALQKERTGSSEQGPSSAALPAGETVGDRSVKGRIASPNSPMKEGEDRDKAQGGERSSSSGCTIAKSGEVVAGPGL